jgi:hypothetical protein
MDLGARTNATSVASSIIRVVDLLDREYCDAVPARANSCFG